MHIDRVVADALLLAGESPGEGATERFGFPDYGDFLRSVAPECAARAVVDTPSEALDGWKALPGEGLQTIAGGGAVLPLPPGSLVLTGIRLSGWETEAGVVLDSGHWLRVWQRRGVEGLKASPARPLVFRTVWRGAPALELWPWKQGDALAGGWYIGRPEPDARGEMEIPGSCYRKTLDYMVLILRQQATMR